VRKHAFRKLLGRFGNRIRPSIKRGSREGVFGHVDDIGPAGIRGWLLDGADPAAQLKVDAYLEEQFLGSGHTVQHRPDISQLMGRPVDCEFLIPWAAVTLPPELKGMEHTATLRIRVLAAASGREIAASDNGVQTVGQLLDYAAAAAPPLDAEADASPEPDNSFPISHSVAPTGVGYLDRLDGLVAIGWAANMIQPIATTVVGIFVDGEFVDTTPADIERPDLQPLKIPQGTKAGFEFPIPRRWLDGRPHQVTARIMGAEHDLIGSFTLTAEIAAAFTAVTANRVAGYIVNLRCPHQPVAVDVWLDGRPVALSVQPSSQRSDLHRHAAHVPHGNAPIWFEVHLPTGIENLSNTTTLRLTAPHSAESLLDQDAVALHMAAVFASMETLQASLLAGDTAIGSEVLRRDITAVLNAARQVRPVDFMLVAPIKDNHLRAKETDVVIPVYKGCDETLACLHSVLASRDANPGMHIHIINDASPDAALTKALRQLAATESFTLHENEQNLGFVATVNRGMRLHDDRDVLLLNSDTVVSGNWLGRLRAAAYSADNIGTVTPFSNRATIFSLPLSNVDNDLPPGYSTQDLDDLCAQTNAGVVIEVPTAMGFCMFIRRAAIDDTGFFDEARFGRGYGEENDFSLRAAARGWRNVAACDVFVEHSGSVSFGTEKNTRIQDNLVLLDSIYPDYHGRVQSFIRQDPLAAPRSRVIMTMMRRLSDRFVLFVAHAWGGGTEKALRDHSERLAAERRQVVILRAGASGTLRLECSCHGDSKPIVCEFPEGISMESLAAQLSLLPIEEVHFHHTIGLPPSIWQLPGFLGVPYEVTVHDFFFICPRINLIDESGEYCGQPGPASCQRCVEESIFEPGVEKPFRLAGNTIEAWRTLHANALACARAVWTPSRSAKEHMQRYLPHLPMTVRPHAEPAFVYQRRRWDGLLPHHVAVIGAIGPQKGSRLLLACAKRALRDELPLRFVVIGHTDCDSAFASLPNVDITGPYLPEQLGDLIAKSRATTALFLSVGPETYCYTLTEAWRHGLHPVAVDLGAIAERINADRRGTVVGMNPRDICDGLMQAVDTSNSLSTTAASNDGVRPARQVLDHAGQTAAAVLAEEFDAAFYLATNPDVAASGADPFEHYCSHGWREGRLPHYQPIVPPQVVGEDEDRIALIRTEFSESYYLSKNPDVAATGIDPAEHYYHSGWREGRNPNSDFDTRFYVKTNEDVLKAGVNPFWHYLVFGRKEDRVACRPGDYRRSLIDSARVPEKRSKDYVVPPGELIDTHVLAGRIDAALAEAVGLVISLSHDCYIRVIGGTQIFIADEQRRFADRQHAYIHLSPFRAQLTLAPLDDAFEVQVVIDGEFAGIATLESFIAILGERAVGFGKPRMFVVHSVLGFNEEQLVKLRTALDPARSVFWLHDYTSLCEGFNLLRDDLAFCNAPPATSMACRICVYGDGRARHLNRMQRLFEGCDFDVLSPSASTLDLWSSRTQLPYASAAVHPHSQLVSVAVEEPPATGDAEEHRVRIGFVGFSASSKGWPIFASLVDEFHSDPRYRFMHFAARGVSSTPECELVITESTPDDRDATTRLLHEHRIDFLAMLSPWPETFSFVAHEAIAAGCRLLCFSDSGNVAALVRRTRLGEVFDDTAALRAFFAGSEAVAVACHARAHPHRFQLIHSGTTATVKRFFQEKAAT
jgi:GT2 family glycosyltransferase/glycosyltransferase involved in cell wall biosynthesis